MQSYQFRHSAVGISPTWRGLKTQLLYWDFPYSESKSLNVPLMGFPQLRDDNTSTSQWAPSRLACRQSKPYVMGFLRSEFFIHCWDFSYSSKLECSADRISSTQRWQRRHKPTGSFSISLGQSKPSAVGYIPLRVLPPLLGFPHSPKLTRPADGIFPTRRRQHMHQATGSLSVSLRAVKILR